MLRLLGLIICICISGCASSPSCNKAPQLSWANTSTITSDIKTLTSGEMAGRKTGSQGAALARSFLQQRFKQIGLQPWQGQYQHAFTYHSSFSNKVGINIIGVVPATTHSDNWRMVIAHYDHLGGNSKRYYPGADDNASGIAGLLQLAEHAIKQTNDVNLLFVATDAEEPGLYGAYALTEQLALAVTTPQIQQIQLAINLDMIGRPNRTKAIYIEGLRKFSSAKVIRNTLTQDNQLCVRTQQPKSFDGSVIAIDYLRASDHYPLHKVGIPWLYFGVPTHRDYHQTTDTLDKLNINFIAAVSESAYQLLKIDTLSLQNSH
ncbi:peptidase M28 [Shewanella sairae]|uniref:Peptidase M28 n=1 Tax=Shewanella sairae TaxID=190310 RepID=A0ABQ4PB17_9GAMM|nr:M28 family peptidase [Shewanella sairae]MCL1130804.1 M28 family peptidase [Shewanella sairae]GIU44597.1 peptidase M28 [Shewanella sairae]